MVAAGSQAEVTSAFKHANLPRFNLHLFYPLSRPLPVAFSRSEKGPWRITDKKLGAAFRKEVRVRYDGQTKASTSVTQNDCAQQILSRQERCVSTVSFLLRYPWDRRLQGCWSPHVHDGFPAFRVWHKKGNFCFGDRSSFRLLLAALLMLSKAVDGSIRLWIAKVFPTSDPVSEMRKLRKVAKLKLLLLQHFHLFIYF